ncbi:hypothetical protein WJX77_005252 [Trebouxia sp. C0004]
MEAGRQGFEGWMADCKADAAAAEQTLEGRMRQVGNHMLLVQSLGQLRGSGLGDQQARLQLASQVVENLGVGLFGTVLC